MKKLTAALFIFVSAFALTTAVYAANQNDVSDWKEMLPMMKQMHPNLSEKQLKEMYEHCRMNGDQTMEQMMNGNAMNQPMMKQGHMDHHPLRESVTD